MKKNLLEIYALSVCFVTLVCFVVSLGMVLYDAIQMVNPEFTMNTWQFEKHQTNEKFSKDWPKDKPMPSDTELTKLRLESYRLAVRVEQREAFQSMARLGIVLFLDVIFFWIHWRLARKERIAAVPHK